MTFQRQFTGSRIVRTGFLLLGVFAVAIVVGVLPVRSAKAVPSPTVNVSDATPFPVTEGNAGTTSVSFDITLAASPDSMVTVSYATMYGSATANDDYVYKETSVTFAAGATGAGLTQTVTVTVNGDTAPESNENFFIQLYNPVNATLGDRFGEAQIGDDDGAAPTLNIGDVAPFLENAMTVNFPITISALPASGSVTVHAATGYGTATAPADYAAVNDQLLTWTNASPLTQNLSVTINEDAFAEQDETFWVQLWDASGATLVDRWGMATILNDDAAVPTISIADDVSAEGTNITINVSLNISPPTAVSVNYASMPDNYFDTDADVGLDYTGVSGVLNWNAGDSGGALTKTINIAVAADGLPEASEHFWVQIYDPIGGNLAAQRYGKGTISAPPVATTDSYAAVGNTKLVVEATPPLGEPHKFQATGDLLENDTDNENDTLTVSGPATTVQGGTLTLGADGKFTYVPVVGFTGADSFTYTLSDGQGNTVNGTANITVANRVWYVNNALGVNGNGTSSSPFNTLANVRGAGDADSSGDYLFLYQGSGNYTGGLPLEASQTLIGQPQGLVVGSDTLLAASGTNPTITNAAGVGIVLAQGNTIRRVNVANTSSAGINGSGINTVDIGPNMTISGSGGAGFSLLGGGNGNVTMAANVIHSNASGRSVFFGGRTGGTVTVSGSVNDTAGGVQLDTNTGTTINFTGGLAISGATETFKATGGGTVSVTGTNTLSSTVGSALNVTGTTIGASGLTFQSINSNGATNGIILNGTGLSGGLTVTGTGSAGSGGTIQSASGDGISLTNVGAAVSLTNMATTGVTGTDVLVNGGGADVTYAGTITNTASRSVNVSNHTGGTVLFSGAINETGTGISLTTNTGTTINFTGGLTMSTGANEAFAATGGGTVTVTGSNNTIVTTTGRALNVANTSIGGAGMTFKSINAGTAASGPTNGILLNNTGSGGLTVAGDGSANSGGTIQKTTGDAISLTSASNINLTRVRIINNLGSGINGNSITNFNIDNSTIDTNGDDAAADEAGIRFTNLAGTSTWTNIVVAHGIEDNARIINTTATLTQLTIMGSTFRDTPTVSPGNNGLLLQSGVNAGDNGSITADITTSSFLRNRANGLQVVTNSAGSVNVEVGNGGAGSGGTFTDNNIGANIAHNSSGTLPFKVNNASFSTPGLVGAASPINLNLGGSATGSGFQGTVANNTITNNNSLTGPGIRIVSNGAGTMTVQVNNNNISAVAAQGIQVLARDGSSTINATILSNTVNLTNAGSLDGIRVDAGATGTDTTKICADIRLNNSTTIAGQFGARVRQRFASTTFTLEGYAGTPTDDAAVATFLNNNNTLSPAASADHAGAGFGTIVNCPTPT